MCKKRIALFPYDGYYIYAPRHHEKENRYYVTMFPIEGEKKQINTAYARYLFSVHTKQRYAKCMEIDHIDGDPTNDVISNLQILSKDENARKHLIDRGIAHATVDIKCPECNQVFTRRRSQTYLSKGGIFTACSRKCSGTFRQRLQVATPDTMPLLTHQIDTALIKEHTPVKKIITYKHQLEPFENYSLPV
jgi:hypothetical protein